MKTPKPTDEYGHGQMMGMLVIIQMLENAREEGMGIRQEVFDKIKSIAGKDLAEYLDKPEEDVYLLVDKQLKEM